MLNRNMTCTEHSCSTPLGHINNSNNMTFETIDIDAPLWFHYLLTVFMLINFIVVVIGNGLTLLAKKNIANMRCHTSTLISSLAVLDLLIGLLLVIDNLVYFNSVHSSIMCQIMVRVEISTVFVSLMHLVALNIDRYLYIATPFFYERWITSRTIILTIISMYSIALVVNLLILQFKFALNLTSNCIFIPESDIQTQLLIVITFVIPLLIIGSMCAALYSVVVKQTRAITKQNTHLANNTSNGKNKVGAAMQNKKMIQTVTAILFAVLFTWGPMVITLTVFSSLGKRQQEIVILYVFPMDICVFALGSATNPFLYALLYPRYREAYKQLLSRCCPRWRTGKTSCVIT